MLESSLVHHLHNELVLVDIPLVDEIFYGDEIKNYKDKLKTICVRFEIKEACEFTRKHLMSLAPSSKLTKDTIVAILKFIKYMGENKIYSEEFISNIKRGKWNAAKPISLLTDIKVHQKLESSDKLLEENPKSEWHCLLHVFGSFPVLDETFYGNIIVSMSTELKKLDVLVESKDTIKEKLNKMEVKFPLELKDCISEEKWLRTELVMVPTEVGYINKDWSKGFSRLTTTSVYSLLDSVKIYKEKKVEIPAKFLDKLSDKKWLKTKCGYKSPDECLLFYFEWEPFLNCSDGPFIDEEY
ncbi:hypothetical protein Tco_0798590 [Tanacetum coccineum]